jgi:hypothetical protein
MTFQQYFRAAIWQHAAAYRLHCVDCLDDGQRHFQLVGCILQVGFTQAVMHRQAAQCRHGFGTGYAIHYQSEVALCFHDGSGSDIAKPAIYHYLEA